MDSAQVRVLEQVHQEGLCALLQRLDRLRLPAQAVAANRHEREGDFADLWEVSWGGAKGWKRSKGWMDAYEAREREFQEQEIGRALVPPDLAQGDGAGLVALWFARDGVAGCG